MQSKTARDLSPSRLKKYRPFRLDKGELSKSTSVAEARSIAKRIASELISRFGARKVVLFGSLARGDSNRRSDIDLAVWGIRPGDYYRAVAFASGFSSVCKVDLVDAEDCSESLLKTILQEGVRL